MYSYISERFLQACQLHEPVFSFESVLLSPAGTLREGSDAPKDPDRPRPALLLKESGFSLLNRSAFAVYLDLLLLYQNQVIFWLHIFLFGKKHLYLLIFVFSLYRVFRRVMGKHPAIKPGVNELCSYQPLMKRAWRSTVSGWMA